ncbi:hypothetical protein [Leeia oryzae]|uniref:hypothetical protein n=1 Tax=Leeia oryzae TaxID=356662 RepID=UPI00037776A6|nr:hypothetical protein [Leeia oryzae]
MKVIEQMLEQGERDIQTLFSLGDWPLGNIMVGGQQQVFLAAEEAPQEDSETQDVAVLGYD